MIQKNLFTTLLFILFLLPQMTFALSQSQATSLYLTELIEGGLTESGAQTKASQEADALFEFMENSQLDMEIAFDSLDTRIKGLHKNDGRREEALAAMSKAEEKIGDFKNLQVQNHFDVQKGVAGALPRLLPTAEFTNAQTETLDTMAEVNRVLISPDRPGTVPEGDLVSDFIPQLVRQLFRFAWLGVLIALIVSGISLVLARDNEENVTKAKGMIYYAFIGFAIIALAFAIVKGITNIDFFNFI